MDREHRKKMQTLRLIITEAIMVITVVVLVVVLTFVAMGYKVNEQGQLDQSGLAQIYSYPTGATITIDGEIMFSKTNTSKLLSAGTHTISYTKDGYDTWSKEVEIRSGWLYKADYGRIFANYRPTEQVRTFKDGLEFLVASPDQESLLYAGTDSFDWKWMNISGDEVNVYSIDTFKYLMNKVDIEKSKEENAVFAGVIQNIIWNNDSNKVLVNYVLGEQTMWSLIDLRNPDSSLNLSDSFSMEFDQVRFANDGGDRLYATENGNLRSISVSNKEISRVLLADITEFGNYKSNLMVVVKQKDGKYIEMYREGEKDAIMLVKAESENVKVGLSEYLSESLWSFVDGDKVVVYQGAYNNEGLKKMTKIIDEDLGFIPETYELHGFNQFLVARKDNQVALFDAELKKLDKYELSGSKMVWVDNHMVASFADEYVTLSDFDGCNKRENFAPANEGYDVVITENGKYFYYVTKNDDSGVVLNRQKLIL